MLTLRPGEVDSTNGWQVYALRDFNGGFCVPGLPERRRRFPRFIRVHWHHRSVKLPNDRSCLRLRGWSSRSYGNVCVFENLTPLALSLVIPLIEFLISTSTYDCSHTDTVSWFTPTRFHLAHVQAIQDHAGPEILAHGWVISTANS